jgi:ATP synthase protein I
MQKDPNKLAELKERLKKAQPSKNENSVQVDPTERKMLGLAARMGLEIVIALGVGVGIGYFLDKFFSTKPLFLILFALFGIAAGVLNVYRLVIGNEYRPGYRSENDKNDKI